MTVCYSCTFVLYDIKLFTPDSVAPLAPPQDRLPKEALAAEAIATGSAKAAMLSCSIYVYYCMI